MTAPAPAASPPASPPLGRRAHRRPRDRRLARGRRGAGPARAASAAHSYNQMTGVGVDRLRHHRALDTGPAEQPEPADHRHQQHRRDPGAEPELGPGGRHPTRPLSFMYSDFKNLKVTVSQTQNITHQGITVSWTGAPPPRQRPERELPADDGVLRRLRQRPEPGGLRVRQPADAGGRQNIIIGDRGGLTCGPGPVPSTNPAADPDRAARRRPARLRHRGAGRRDRSALRTRGDRRPACSGGKFYIPFVPVNDPPSRSTRRARWPSRSTGSAPTRCRRRTPPPTGPASSSSRR